jgi:hypothetical protein
MLLTRRPGPQPAPQAAAMRDGEEAWLLAEYEQLKPEQRQRIATRDGLLYAVLASAGTALAFTVTARNPALLLLIPPACTILGWAYMANDVMISKLGNYFAAELAPRLAALRPHAGPAFGWETAHKTPRHSVMKAGQAVVDLLAFAFPSAAAITAALIISPRSGLLTAGAAADTAVTLLLTARIIAQFGTVLRTGR